MLGQLTRHGPTHGHTPPPNVSPRFPAVAQRTDVRLRVGALLVMQGGVLRVPKWLDRW